MGRTLRGGWIVALVLVACGDEDSTGETFGDPTGPMTTSGGVTSTAAMTTAGSTSAPGDGSGSAEDGPPVTDGLASSSDGGPGSSSDTTSPADSSDSAGGVCEGPQANECLDCVVPACCQQWAACQADEGCACVIQCHVVRGGSLGSCESQCNSDGELYEGVFFCGQQSCLGACEWDCC